MAGYQITSGTLCWTAMLPTLKTTDITSEKSSFHTLLIQRQNLQFNRCHVNFASFNHLKKTNLNTSNIDSTYRLDRSSKFMFFH